MTQLLQFCILGLGAGAAYTMLAQGAILVYRGSGLVNFAQGAVSMAGAYLCFEEFETNQGWGFAPLFRRRGGLCGSHRPALPAAGPSPDEEVLAADQGHLHPGPADHPPGCRGETVRGLDQRGPALPAADHLPLGFCRRPGRPAHPHRDRRRSHRGPLGLDALHQNRSGHYRKLRERARRVDVGLVAQHARCRDLERRLRTGRSRRCTGHSDHRTQPRRLHPPRHRLGVGGRVGRWLHLLPADTARGHGARHRRERRDALSAQHPVLLRSSAHDGHQPVGSPGRHHRRAGRTRSGASAAQSCRRATTQTGQRTDPLARNRGWHGPYRGAGRRGLQSGMGLCGLVVDHHRDHLAVGRPVDRLCRTALARSVCDRRPRRALFRQAAGQCRVSGTAGHHWWNGPRHPGQPRPRASRTPHQRGQPGRGDPQFGLHHRIHHLQQPGHHWEDPG